MERKKKKDKGGFYIALCCCAVIVAAVGYAGRISMVPEEEAEPEKMTQLKDAPKATLEPIAYKEAEQKANEVEANNNVVIEEPLHFELPVAGKIIAEYSGDDLVYNETLKDWRAHSGVDFAAKLGEEVLASADGTVEDVFDSEMGRCIIINHKDGFATMYANLSDETKLKKGETVKKGDVIGTIGNTSLGDVTEGEHLHYEIIKDGKNVNPVDYLD